VTAPKSLVKQIEHHTTAPALVLSFAILCTLIIPLVVHLPEPAEKLADRIGWAAWALFTLEYCLRLFVATDRSAFVRENLTDLAMILVALPTPLVAGNETAFSVLRGIRVLIVAFEIGKDVSHLCRTRNVPYALAIVALAVITCGVLGFHFEHTHKGANILDPRDGMWWAVTTISTVGYGDMYPITWPGRFIAIVLMVVGIAFTGIISAALVSVFLRKTEMEVHDEDQKFEERVQRAVRNELAPLQAQLQSLVDANRPKDG
jgi:voltage-gated potassium channel